MGRRVTNLLAVFHHHVDFIHGATDRDIEHVDDVVVLEVAKDGYFPQCGDGDSILTIFRWDADLLQGNDFGGSMLFCTEDDTVG